MDAGSATDLPALPIKKQPMLKLNRQGTFKQGSNGTVDHVDISQSPRSSRSSSRTIDRPALDQIQRMKLADDCTPEVLEAEYDDGNVGALDRQALSPRSSNGSTSTTPRSLPSGKPSLVLKRQGTFVQRRDGQADHVELSPGIEIKRRLSAESTRILHETIGDSDHEYDDEDYEQDTDHEDQTPEEPLEEVAVATTTAAEPEPAQTEPPAEQDDDEYSVDDEDQFSMMPALTVSSRVPIGHNRKGTFLQSSSGKAMALDMSSRSAQQIASGEILTRDHNQISDITEDEPDNDDSPDLEIAAPPSRPKPHLRLERNGTFIQSKSGATAPIELGSTAVAMTGYQPSELALLPIKDDDGVSSEVSTDDQSRPTESTDRVRMGSLNSTDNTTSSGIGQDSSDGAESPNNAMTEASARHDMMPVLPLASPEPLLQRKATYVQTKSGQTVTLVMTANETVTNPIPASFDIIDEERNSETSIAPFQSQPPTENDHVEPFQSQPPADDDHVEDGDKFDDGFCQSGPSPPVQYRVDVIKRQEYLKNRKGTFAANENGKMVHVSLGNPGPALTAVGCGLDHAISIGTLIEDENNLDGVPDHDEHGADNAALEVGALIQEDVRTQGQASVQIVDPALRHDLAESSSSDLQKQPGPEDIKHMHGMAQNGNLHVDEQDRPGPNAGQRFDERDSDDSRPLQRLDHDLVKDDLGQQKSTNESDDTDLVRFEDNHHDSANPSHSATHSAEKRVQISADVVVIETDQRRSSRTSPRKVHLSSPDHNIQRMLATAERDRQLRTRRLRKLEKRRIRSRSVQQQQAMIMLPKLIVTPIRAHNQAEANSHLDFDLRQQYMRPTSAERFVQTYRVYAPGPSPRAGMAAAATTSSNSAARTQSQQRPSRRASSTN